MRISTDRTALGAAVVAMAHRDDFQRLGATDIDADASGVSVSFATAKQADVAHELVNAEFTPEIDGSTSPVPFGQKPTPSGSHVGWTDATDAIALLAGVTSVDVSDRAAAIFVTTQDARATARIDALLRDQILGLDVLVTDGRLGSDTRGWGDGIG